MSDNQKKILENRLWAVANVLRDKMDADEYKNYILGFIFYKYLSENLENYVNKKLIINDGYTFIEIDEESEEGQQNLIFIKDSTIGQLGYFLNPSQLFSQLVKKGSKINSAGNKGFILGELKTILVHIENTSRGTGSEDGFKGLFDDVDLTSSKLGTSENKKNDAIVDVLTELNGIDFKLEDSKSDLLGDAYEYLIGQFASGAGKKGGEFYTPAQVSRLLARIVSNGKKNLKSVYDPTCGSGSLLLRLRDYTKVNTYYGQESKSTTYNLARMNMILHGVHFNDFVIKHGDTLEDDLHSDLEAEAIVANPPFSAQWKSEKDASNSTDDRYSQYGRLAPNSKADYAFITHMLYHLADNGIMAVVMPHGALFRGGAEGHIRKYIIEKLDCLDAVIGLPSNIFFGTSIPTSILVFSKCRKDEDVIFIDASKEYTKEKTQNKLTDENITKIFETYKNRTEIAKYSHRASKQQIHDNDYNLNIPRYVDTFTAEENIDIDQVAKKLEELDQKLIKTNQTITSYCQELGINTPF